MSEGGLTPRERASLEKDKQMMIDVNIRMQSVSTTYDRRFDYDNIQDSSFETERWKCEHVYLVRVLSVRLFPFFFGRLCGTSHTSRPKKVTGTHR